MQGQQGRNALGAIYNGPFRVLIGIHLNYQQLALVLSVQIFKNRSSHTAESAPGHSEINQNGKIGQLYYFLKLLIVDADQLDQDCASWGSCWNTFSPAGTGTFRRFSKGVRGQDQFSLYAQ